LPLAAIDEITRQRNGPEIVEFLAFAPDVCAQLCLLDPIEAARKVSEMSEDLDVGRMPDDSMDYETFRDLRNEQEASRRSVRKEKHQHGGR